MFSRLSSRFGIPGVISVIALVFAMAGGAYAAKSVIITKLNQISPSVQKQLKGKAGTAGAAGVKGDPGAVGASGAKGEAGSSGASGANGKTVLNGTGAPSAGIGTEGDFYIDTAASKIYGPKTTSWGSGTSLKGAQGVPGPEGVCSTSDCVLPSETTETGIYSVPGDGGLGTGTMAEGDEIALQVSFPIPAAPAPTFVFVPGTTSGFGANAGAGCPGVTAESLPQADPGKFCVYGVAEEFFGNFVPSATVMTRNPASGTGDPGVTPVGTAFNLTCNSAVGFCFGKGLWAVTAS